MKPDACTEPRPTPTSRLRIRPSRLALVGFLLPVLGVLVFLATYLSSETGAAEPGKAARAAAPDKGKPTLATLQERERQALQWLQRHEKKVLDVQPKPIASDKSVRYDWDIVYVRAPRTKGKSGNYDNGVWPDISRPNYAPKNSDLMLLHPDGTEELLVAGGLDGGIQDTYVSFDGEWVYYAHFHDLSQADPWAPGRAYSDIYKIHVKSRKSVRLTYQEFSPNTGAISAQEAKIVRKQKATVYNSGPCPLPGGKVMFTSNRNGFRPPRGYPSVTLQLFVMDDDGSNVEQIGYLNLAGALHPTILTDGRVVFSSLESQGGHNEISWGVWSIHPDGTNWGPIISALENAAGAVSAWHFQSQLSDGSLVVERYYNQNNSGFGWYAKLPTQVPEGVPAFGPGDSRDPRNPMLVRGRLGPMRQPFSPYGIESFTRFARDDDGPADHPEPGKRAEIGKEAPGVGKVTHPSGVPDNHLLTVWSPGPANHQYNFLPAIHGQLCLIRSGKPIDEPGQMLLIKADPNYHIQWPRALVPYQRIYGIDQPRALPSLANDGKLSPQLPEGTPFALVGTSSFYKRESWPGGIIRPGSVTATDPGNHQGEVYNPINWSAQGSDAGVYSNQSVHAVRIVAQEPTSREPVIGQRFYSHANEKLRILAEIPVRKFNGDKEPLDPDGNPDTSFLAKIPADGAWTFQLLDEHGMVLTTAQTWHQLRPGEIRNDCGGCHAHSQKPTRFELTAAARSDYPVWNIAERTPLLTSKARDESGKKWDRKDETGVRFVKGVVNVEYYRDIKPILDRSCVACHTQKSAKPAAGLILDDSQPLEPRPNKGGAGVVFGGFARLAADAAAGYGRKPFAPLGSTHAASRYITMFRSRESLLVWKLFGQRMDGIREADLRKNFGYLASAHFGACQISYSGSIMPPPEAVAGTYQGPEGKKIKVAPVTDEDRLTIVRWIDLGCPIDLDFDPGRPSRSGYGWMLDENRPTMAVTYPKAGVNDKLERILVGMFDYNTGLDTKSFTVKADFPIDGIPAGRDLASKFKQLPDWRWELRLNKPIEQLKKGKLTVTVKDNQGNISSVERTFSVGNTTTGTK
jgi:hypothetical protein